MFCDVDYILILDGGLVLVLVMMVEVTMVLVTMVLVAMAMVVEVEVMVRPGGECAHLITRELPACS